MVSERPSQEGKLSAGAPNDPVPFGKYYLLGLIARGGMAEVYRAKLVTGERRIFAVKVMRPQLAREARFIDMFHREGKLAMMLSNRCIVETMEIGQHDDGRHYIAMEYIGGRDLTQVLRKCQETQQRIPVPHAVYIAARIAEGLHFAHTLQGPDGRTLNIVNRDVSPSNVRMSYDGDVKLLDFGIAQALMKFTSEIGILKGKFSYMSPEQIRGMPLDARTDVFSAGIILHEMLTTEKLFRGDTEFALMEKVRKAEVAPPSNFNRRVTPELDAISLKALARCRRPLSELRAARCRPRRTDRGLSLRSQGAAPVHAPAVPQGVREGARGERAGARLPAWPELQQPAEPHADCAV